MTRKKLVEYESSRVFLSDWNIFLYFVITELYLYNFYRMKYIKHLVSVKCHIPVNDISISKNFESWTKNISVSNSVPRSLNVVSVRIFGLFRMSQMCLGGSTWSNSRGERESPLRSQVRFPFGPVPHVIKRATLGIVGFQRGLGFPPT
jgi:hypothetical protein